ncbi:hypothetical protein GCM10022421_08750 [Oceanisphaera sediminis]|uniref:Uncharacterized protein n=1 Tax=Oceanisphaera sediminis TaxID=981381 RepID=A0ABP7DGF0_9GAMM
MVIGVQAWIALALVLVVVIYGVLALSGVGVDGGEHEEQR